MSLLFRSCPPNASAGYRALFAAKAGPKLQLRERLEKQYQALSAFLDSQFCTEFCLENGFHSRVWELQVGSALLRSDHALCPRSHRQDSEGPDLTVPLGQTQVHVEAICPEPGRIAMQWARMLSADGFDFDAVEIDAQVTRLTGAIANKRKQRDRHVRSGAVRPNEPFVIAIGDHGSKLVYDPHKPPILDALFGLGPLQISIDAASGELRGPARISRQDDRASKKGTPINSFLFGGVEPALEVSAVLFSASNLFCSAEESFDDFMFIHNPVASNPVPEGFVRVGSEWARRGDQIERVAVHTAT